MLCTIIAIADGVHCQNLFNEYAYLDDLVNVDTSGCWTDATAGELRFMLVVSNN
jgi:hypothetical protein